MNEIINDLLKPKSLKEEISDYLYYLSGEIRYFFRDLERFFRNLWRYRRILWKDNDFDYGYLISILLTKLSFMATYFRTARIVEGSERTYKQINLTLRLGKIVNEEEDTEFTGYINIKNASRFYKHFDTLYQRSPKVAKEELRRVKAKHLFYKFLEEYSEYWWD